MCGRELCCAKFLGEFDDNYTVLDVSGNVVTDGKMATGYKIALISGETVLNSYTVVIFAGHYIICNIHFINNPTKNALTADVTAQPIFKAKSRFICTEYRLNARPSACKVITYIFSPLRSDESISK